MGMNARQKLNQVYATGAIVVAAVVGAALNSWWAFGVGLAVLLGLTAWGGSIRLAPARRMVR
jgi:hypothetical protein